MTDKELTVELTGEQFESFIKNNEIVFIDYWAKWCAPCRNFARVYEKVAGQHQSVKFAKVNIEKETDLAEAFQIRTIPHVMAFKEGIAIYSEAGSMPESTLTELVEQAKAADVSEIRSKLDSEE